MTATTNRFRAFVGALEAQFGSCQLADRTCLEFRIDDEGDGTVFVRGADADSLIRQAERCVAFVEQQGRRPRRVLVSAGTVLVPGGSKGSLFKEVPDPALRALINDASSAWCSWVAYASTHHLSANAAIAQEVIAQLKRSNVDVLNVAIGGVVPIQGIDSAPSSLAG